MKYRIIVFQKAEEMLYKHLAFIANVSKEASVKEKNRIIRSMRNLSEDPDIYPFLDEEFIPKNKYHKMVVDKRYMILYQIKDKTVYVDYIIDTRQDYAWLIR